MKKILCATTILHLFTPKIETFLFDVKSAYGIPFSIFTRFHVRPESFSCEFYVIFHVNNSRHLLRNVNSTRGNAPLSISRVHFHVSTDSKLRLRMVYMVRGRAIFENVGWFSRISGVNMGFLAHPFILFVF